MPTHVCFCFWFASHAPAPPYLLPSLSPLLSPSLFLFVSLVAFQTLIFAHFLLFPGVCNGTCGVPDGWDVGIDIRHSLSKSCGGQCVPRANFGGQTGNTFHISPQFWNFIRNDSKLTWPIHLHRVWVTSTGETARSFAWWWSIGILSNRLVKQMACPLHN